MPCWGHLVAHQILIPRGARAGTRVVLPGEVDDPMGGAPGDVIVNVVEMRHPRFTRRYDGLDLGLAAEAAPQGRAESEGHTHSRWEVAGGWVMVQQCRPAGGDARDADRGADRLREGHQAPGREDGGWVGATGQMANGTARRGGFE